MVVATHITHPTINNLLDIFPRKKKGIAITKAITPVTTKVSNPNEIASIKPPFGFSLGKVGVEKLDSGVIKSFLNYEKISFTLLEYGSSNFKNTPLVGKMQI